MRRTLTLFATQLLLWFVVAEVNHHLTGYQLYVFVAALFVAFGALTQPLRSGLAASLMAGLMCDATTPVVFGTHLLIFAAAHLVLFHVRERIPRDDAISITIVVVLTNLVLYLLFCLTQFHHTPAPAILWPRIVADLVASQVLLALITPWFYALQARALMLARVRREEAA